MNPDHPAFIQCANDAYEIGMDIARIEAECSCLEATPASNDIHYPSALHAVLDMASFTLQMKTL